MMREALSPKQTKEIVKSPGSGFPRRQFLKGVGATVLTLATPGPVSGLTGPETPSERGTPSELELIAKREQVTTYALIDESIVAQTFAMRREAPTPPPVREGPILTPAWAYGSVIRESSGLFRMWYMAPPPYCEYYATSMDGTTWETPALNLVSPDLGAGPNAFLCENQRDRNGRWLVGEVGPEGFSVLDAEVQPHPAAKARFTSLYLARFGEDYDTPPDRDRGLCIAYSDDGIHWIADEHNPVIPGWHDTSNCLMYDACTGKYLIFGRPPVHVQPRGLEGRSNRLVSRMESADLLQWSSPCVILDTDERDADAFSLTNENEFDEDDGPGIKIRGRDRQFYGMTAFQSAGVYIGLAQMYEVPSGNTWLELVHSRDGLDWIREPLREPHIGPRPGTWESRQVRPAMATPPVRVGDEEWIYYSASPHSHHAGKAFEGRGIGVRALKADRWIAYRSSDREAELLTHPIESGARLWLNASTGPEGWIRVAVVDAWGNALDGVRYEDCRPIRGDALRHEVGWQGQASMPALPDQVRLRIRSCNASVFAFYLATA